MSYVSKKICSYCVSLKITLSRGQNVPSCFVRQKQIRGTKYLSETTFAIAKEYGCKQPSDYVNKFNVCKLLILGCWHPNILVPRFLVIIVPLICIISWEPMTWALWFRILKVNYGKDVPFREIILKLSYIFIRDI